MKQKIFNIGALLVIMACAGVIALQAQGGRVQAAQPAPQAAPTQQQPQYQQQPQQQTQQPQQQYQQAPPPTDQQAQQCPPVPPQMNQPQYQNGPQVNIGRRHGNLRQAQIFLVQSYQAVSQAQAANDYELADHAARAKELIVQADVEIRLAANVSNQEGH